MYIDSIFIYIRTSPFEPQPSCYSPIHIPSPMPIPISVHVQLNCHVLCSFNQTTFFLVIKENYFICFSGTRIVDKRFIDRKCSRFFNRNYFSFISKLVIDKYHIRSLISLSQPQSYIIIWKTEIPVLISRFGIIP